MPYATAQDMTERFGVQEMIQLTDIAVPRLGAVNTLTLDRALGDASAEIDGYLVGRVTLPLAAPPALCRVYCCDIARYRLMSVRADDRAKAAYDAAIAWLKRIADGTISLLAPAEAPAAAGLGPVIVTGGDRDFARGNW